MVTTPPLGDRDGDPSGAPLVLQVERQGHLRYLVASRN